MLTPGSTLQLSSRAFRLLRRLEANHGVETWLAGCLESGIEVIVKLSKGCCVNRNQETLLWQEASVLSELRSPYFAPLLSFGRYDEGLALVTAVLPGETLEKKVRSQPLTFLETISLGCSVAAALEELHALGYSHGDLKPAHVLLDGSSVTLCDFGLSYRMQAEAESAVGATVLFAAPEQLGLISSKLSPSADLYSLGLLLQWAMDPASVEKRAVFHIGPVRPETLPGCPKALIDIIERLTQTEPTDRYATATGVRHDLEDLKTNPHRDLVLGRQDRRRVLAEPSFVGRQELTEAIYERLKSGSEPVLLGARSGMGKSRLLQAVAERYRREGHAVFGGQGIASSGGTVLPVWERLSRELAQWIGRRPGLVAELRHKLAERGDILVQAFPGLRPLFEATAATQVHPQETVLESLVLLVELLKEKEKALFFFDDIQWADAFTIDFLRVQTGGVAIAFRSEELACDHILLQESPEVLELPPLNREQAQAMLESMAGPLPKPALDSIIEAALGEPFLLQSLLRGALENESLKESSQGWLWAPSGATPSSDKRDGWRLSSRIRGLSENVRSFLGVGALLGKTFSTDLASQLIEIDPSGTTEVVNQAVNRGLLRCKDGQAGFTHDKIRETLLEFYSKSQRCELHRKAALWYETHSPDNVRELALHWHQGGDDERALPFALKAAQQAQARMDYPDASTFYRLALEVSVERMTSELHREILKAFALSLAAFDSGREVLQVFEAALEVHKGDGRERAELLAGLADQLGRLNDSEYGFRVGAEAFRIMGTPLPQSRIRLGIEALSMLLQLALRSLKNHETPPTENALRRVELCESQLESATRGIKMDVFLWCLLRGLLDLSDSQPRPQGSRLLIFASQISASLGLQKLAARFREQGLVGGRLRPRTAAHVTGQAGLGLLMEGNLLGALRQFEEAMPLCRLCNDTWNLAVCQHHAALCYYLLGQFQQAEALATVVLNRKVHGDSSNSLAGGRLLALLGRAQGYEAAIEFHELELRDTCFSALGYMSSGLMALRREDWQEASHQLQLSVDKHTRLLGPHTAGCAGWLALAYRSWAEKLPYEQSAQRSQLLRQASRAVKIALRYSSSFPVTQPHAFREYALSCAHAGRFYLARTNFEKALQIAEKLEMKMETAWTLYERGRFAPTAGWPDWQDDFATGLAQLQALGAWVPGVDMNCGRSQHHLAQLDRFDQVLEGGRGLVLLERQDDVLEGFQEQARLLLRCQKVMLIRSLEEAPEMSQTLYQKCLAEGRTVTESVVEEPTRSLLLHEAKSTLMAPLRVGKQVLGVLVAWQKSVGGFFGEEEIRLADYLCTLAGAALENARIVHQRTHAFTALQTSEQRFRDFFDYAGIGTALLDEQGKSLQENPHLRLLLGTSTLGEAPWEYCHNNDLKTLKLGFQNLRLDSHRFDNEVRFYRSNGELLWTQTCLVKLPFQDGDSTRYLMTVADTTHRRIAQMTSFLENERQGLAAEVHDELAQNISALHMMLAGIETTDARLLKAQKLAKGLLDDAGHLISSLRNPLAEGVDLAKALETLVTEFSIENECQMVVQWPSHFPNFSDLANLVLYRVLQEGLVNISKHSQASLVGLDFQVDSTHLEMHLWDNGLGFETEHWLTRCGVQKHFGLLAMRDRLEMIGGTLTISSVPQEKTILAARLPFSKA